MTIDPRQLLKEADHERKVAQWAESLRTTIRLQKPIHVGEMKQRGPFGRKNKYLYELDDRMPHEAVDMLYRALWKVREEALTRAASLEAQVKVNNE